MNLKLLILLVLITPCLLAASPSDGLSLDSLLESVATDVLKHDYASAAKRLNEANPANVAEIECQKGAGRYCSINGYSRSIPGINKKISLMNILNDSKSYITIRGTSDFTTHEHELEFQDFAESFAAQYNMHVQYWNEKIGRKTIGIVSLEATRVFIDLPVEVWETLPLNSKLRMRYLAEIADDKTSQ